MTAPCLKRLDADCFRSQPAWAKRAFAYRLVHLLTPKPLTKRLPAALRLALLAPGLEIPPGVILPDGMVVSPGAEFPAGWQPGDPAPPGAIPPATTPPGVDTTGATPPTYAEVWSPGPVSTASTGVPAPVEPWFYDDFAAIDTPPWTAGAGTGATASIVSGKLALQSTIGGEYAMLSGTENAAQPDTFFWSWELTLVSGTGPAFVSLWTGSHQLQVKFVQPTSVYLRHANPAQDTLYPAANFLNQTIVWTLTYNGSQYTLYAGTALIATITDPTVDSWGKGYGEITVEDVCLAYFDDYTITPL